MKIRRYIANTAQEAMLKIKMDLGRDAIVLNTRKVRQKGLFKIFSKPLVEVLAAVDDDYSVKKAREDGGTEDKNIATARQVKDDRIKELENKLNTMESVLVKLYEQIKTSKQNGTAPGDINSSILQVFRNNLLKNEVDPDIVNKIISTAGHQLGGKQNPDLILSHTTSVLYNIISGILGKPQPITLRNDGKPTVVIFLGPTGVGKTTTLAKIAANFALTQKKNVAFLTADTYRIAAVEQLKTYAEILGIPIGVVYSPNEICDALGNFADKDIILIDTAGRSHKNKHQFDELKTLVGMCKADEVFLVISATTSIGSCRDIIDKYGFLDDYKLIFTKLDEAAAVGSILNVRHMTNKNLSYFATGQNVPDDIEVANLDRITKSLLGSLT